MASRHIHQHLHKRQHHHDNPFEEGLSSLAAGINSFFGGGDSNPPKPTPPAAPAPPSLGQGPAPAPAAQTNDGNNNNNNHGGAKTVFVTASSSMTGDFTWSTIGIAPATSRAAPTVPTREPIPVQSSSTSDSDDDEPSTTSAKRTNASSQRTTLATATAAASTALSSITSSSSSNSGASLAAATTTPTSVATTQDTGMSGGAKAGIAIGVILAILLLAAGAFFLYRKKKQNQDELDAVNEKDPFSDKAADRLPVAPAPATYMPAAPFEQRPAGPNNPFGVGAVPVDVSGSPTMASSAEKAAMIGGAGVAVVGKRSSVPAPLNLNRAQSPALVPPQPVVPSPVGSAFSESSTMTAGGMAAAGGAGAGGAAGPRMHRVQMDFNPTMEDELHIKAGEIVRCVKEFDDGWCSVEVLQRDNKGNVIRHEQGVVPRTCLSRLPLKPRQKRPGPQAATTNGPSPLNNSTTVGRTQSPALIPNQTQRSMSPGPYGGGPQDKPQPKDTRDRSNSAGDISRPKVAPIGPSPMNPATQTPSSIELPIQLQSPHPPSVSTNVPAPFAAGHARNASAGSSASTPVMRKPVPTKQHTSNLSQ